MSDEQVGRTAVKDQMMKVYQKMYRLLSLNNPKPVKGNFLQVEWPDKLGLVLSQLLFRHLCDSVALQQRVDRSIVEVGYFISPFILCAASNQPCKLAGSRMGEDITIGHMQSCFVCLNDDTGDNERCAAQLEEVIRGSYLIHLQDVGKDVAEDTLRFVHRFCIGRCYGELRLWQCLYIRLPVGCHWHLL